MMLQQMLIIILINFQIKMHVGEDRKSTCGQRLINHTPLIYNGFSSQQGDWPWHAVIFDFSNVTLKYSCGGTVLNSNTILTAAHCVMENNRVVATKRVIISLGKLRLSLKETNSESFSTHMITPHPEYNTSNHINDIAIIQLSTQITFNNYVQPICLWHSNRLDISDVIGKSGTVVGFGVTETKEVSDILRHISIPVVSFHTCLESNRDVFGKLVSENNFCAGFKNATTPCLGDSGGGFTFNENGIYYIRGIVSLTARGSEHVDQPCSLTDYVLFTDVAKYLNWIEKVVPELKSSKPSESVTNYKGPVTYQLSGNVMWSSNCDFYGGDFKSQRSQMDDCGDICSNNDVCTHFTWIPSGLCLLKNIGGDPSAVANNNALCGYIARHSAIRSFDFHTFQVLRWSLNCRFSGNDISNVKSSSVDCAAICEDRGDCTHFNWNSYQNGTCWLKGSTISIPKNIDDPNALCGFFVSGWKRSGKVRWNHNCDYRGNEIANQKFSRNACKEWCNRRSDCQKFAWINLDEGSCFLYGSRATIIAPDTNGTICGWIQRG